MKTNCGYGRLFSFFPERKGRIGAGFPTEGKNKPKQRKQKTVSLDKVVLKPKFKVVCFTTSWLHLVMQQLHRTNFLYLGEGSTNDFLSSIFCGKRYILKYAFNVTICSNIWPNREAGNQKVQVECLFLIKYS